MEDESQSQSQPGMVLEPPTSKKSDRPRHRNRRRRRSSARFLRLSGRLMEDIDEEEEEEEEVESEQNLGDMYKRAIRMNAENRINASNSWNLRLIENIDKFLEDDDESPEREQSRSISEEDGENQDPAEPEAGSHSQGKVGKEKRVNFTKASCTLDASVKIYSYRVDDVHLSSYKVLANLNRTENGEGNNKKPKKKDSQPHVADSEVTADLDDDEDDAPAKRRYKSAETIEANVANINMSKLDSAYDIDPLFHKMSKTFDEGGAKGLLLVNLGVGDKGCNIVFDSKAEECEEERVQYDAANQERNEGMIDISSLLSKLDSVEAEQPIESLTMVPQLAPLRDQYLQLEQQGFVDQRKQPSKRYASTQKEENEADKSIHQEALERSRASVGGLGRSFATQEEADEDDAPMYAPDDFGGGDDTAGGDDDVDFDAFIALDDNGERFSSISFRESFSSVPENKTQADVLLDAICAGDMLGNVGEYQFFDSQALEMSMSENQWAGSAHYSFSHWKRSEPARKRQEKEKAKKSSQTKKTRKKKNNTMCVDLTARPVLEDILRKPPKGKRGSNPLQMSKTMVATKTKEDNLLPYDTGVGVGQLSSLFLRQATVPTEKEKGTHKNKTVCFDNEVETFGGGNDGGFDDSFGGDDDGPGFAFAGDDDAGAEYTSNENDDFVLEELKRVRKVDTKSVQVGYATVAKKVDVRRLKRDLWTGIESSILSKKSNDSDAIDDDAEPDDSLAGGLSFHDTVRELEERKTQMDVTLPFYFICVLHLANEKGLQLESLGLEDFVIRNDSGVTTPSV